MTTGKCQIFKIDGQNIELVQCYTFLGWTVTKEGMCTMEIQIKIMMGKISYVKIAKNPQRKKCN